MRIGIGKVQLRLSQKCVGLRQSFLEPFFFTDRRTWSMVRRLCKCVFKSTQMWRMVLVMKAFLLDGKNQRDRPDAFFCPLPELIWQKTTPMSIVFYYALNLASCFF